MNRETKLYSLFRTMGRWTSNSQHYRHGSTICFVAAKSIKQAFFLAAREIWYDGDTGILELARPSDCENYLGEQYEQPRHVVGKARPLRKMDLDAHGNWRN